MTTKDACWPMTLDDRARVASDLRVVAVAAGRLMADMLVADAVMDRACARRRMSEVILAVSAARLAIDGGH